MEITRTHEGGFRASQEDYIKDKEGVSERKGMKIPMVKESAPLPEEPTPMLVNGAQKLVGELM